MPDNLLDDDPIAHFAAVDYNDRIQLAQNNRQDVLQMAPMQNLKGSSDTLDQIPKGRTAEQQLYQTPLKPLDSSEGQMITDPNLDKLIYQKRIERYQQRKKVESAAKAQDTLRQQNKDDLRRQR